VQAWKQEGKTVKVVRNGKRKTGGWAQMLPDMEFFAKRESERAVKDGRKLFLWGHSMVSWVG
jgi:acylglycerol lipase